MRTYWRMLSSGCFAVMLVLWSGKAVSDPISETQALTFSTAGQSLWAPGTDAVASANFSLNLINLSVPDTQLGVITSTTTAPNPAYDAYVAAVDTCSVLPVGAQACIDLLGSPPPQTITVPVPKNGATLNFSGSLQVGLSGGVSITPGSVTAGYSAQAGITVDKDAAAPGQVITIGTSASNATTSLSSDFGGIQAALDAQIAASLNASVTAYVDDVGGTVAIPGVNIPLTDVPLVTATVEGPTATITVPALNKTLTEPSGQTIPLGIPVLQAPGVQVQVPFTSLTFQVPTLASMNEVSGTGITNDIEPSSQSCVTLLESCLTNPTDFFSASMNLAAISFLATGVPLGIKASVGPLGELGSVEIDAVAGDLSEIEELSEKLTFDPNLQVDLIFNQPVEIEVSPGLFETVSSYTVPIGQSVSLLEPASDLTVYPVYNLADNTFTNDTEALLQFLESVELLHYQLGGLSSDALSKAGIPSDYTVLSQSFPLGNAIDLGPLDPSFPLEGFDDVNGTAFTIAALTQGEVTTTPEPSSLLLLMTALAGCSACFSALRRRSSRNRITGEL